MFRSALVALDLSPADRPIRDGLPRLRRWGIERIVLCHVIALGCGQCAMHGKQHACIAWLERCAAPLRAGGAEASAAPHAPGAPAPGLPAAAPLVVRMAKHGSPIASASSPAAHAPAAA